MLIFFVHSTSGVKVSVKTKGCDRRTRNITVGGSYSSLLRLICFQTHCLENTFCFGTALHWFTFKLLFFKQWSDLEVGKEVLRLLVVLGLHDDVRQLVDDDVEGPLGGQRLAEINL